MSRLPMTLSRPLGFTRDLPSTENAGTDVAPHATVARTQCPAASESRPQLRLATVVGVVDVVLLVVVVVVVVVTVVVATATCVSAVGVPPPPPQLSAATTDKTRLALRKWPPP